MKIVTWASGSPYENKIWKSSIKDIFFETSVRKDFDSDEAREDFWRKWTAYYFEDQPHHIYLAVDGEKVLGYLMGCPDSQNARQKLVKNNPSYDLFADQFGMFPAHLHINFTAAARGQGGGHLLVSTFIDKLLLLPSTGVHIVTSPAARNVRFYAQEGFDILIERHWNASALLFMGRRLESTTSKP